MAFALTPAHANNAVLDYTTREGMKAYLSSTKELYLTNASKFDCKPNGLPNFIYLVTERSRDEAYSTLYLEILSIPRDTANPVDFDDLMAKHGKINLEHLRVVETLYIRNNTRAAQDSHNLYCCLMALLTTEAQSKISVWGDQYTIGNYQLVVLLAKVIIQESHLDTNVKSSQIHFRLASIDKFVLTVGCNINVLNLYFKKQLVALNARGETTDDLLVNLFKTYKAVKDVTFIEYIQHKKELYKDGGQLTMNKLMLMANKKFKLLKLTKR